MKRNEIISILLNGEKPRVLKSLALEVIPFLMKREKAGFSELNIMFCDDMKIKELNFEFRKKNKPTDIITFCYEEGKIKGMIGDIAISVQTAKRQAKEHGHSLKTEVTILLVHGFYHLMGYDHIKDSDHKKMSRKEEEALEALSALKSIKGIEKH